MKFSQVTPNAAPALADYLMGVTSGSVDFRVTLQNLVTVIMKNSLLFNPYKFCVYRNAALNAGGNPLIFDTKVFDTGTNYSTSTGLFTAPIAGFYQFNALIGISLSGVTGYQTLFYKNGVGVGTQVQINQGTASSYGLSSSKMINLAAGDTFNVATAGTTAALNVGSQSTNYFDGALISAT